MFLVIEKPIGVVDPGLVDRADIRLVEKLGGHRIGLLLVLAPQIGGFSIQHGAPPLLS
jgi:hypothetical protein